MKLYLSLTLCALFLFCARQAQAGSITSNSGSATDSNGVASIVELSAGDYLLNLDATQDGIADSGSDPTGEALVGTTNTVYVPTLSLTLTPGTYSITNGITSTSADSDFSAWNFQSDNGTPWVWEFLTVTIPDSSTGTGTITNNYLPGPYQRFATQPEAAAFGADFSEDLTVTTTETVAFALDDDILGDNLGGLVLEVESVPEPSTTWLGAIGLLAILSFRLVSRKSALA